MAAARVQLDNWGRLKAIQLAVKQRNLGPVRIIRPLGLGVQRSDRSLELEGPRPTDAKGTLDERRALLYPGTIPLRTVLFL